MDYLRKLQVLTPHLGQMRDTVKETRGSLLAETLKVSGGIPTLDMTRNVFVSTLGSNPTDVAMF